MIVTVRLECGHYATFVQQDEQHPAPVGMALPDNWYCATCRASKGLFKTKELSEQPG